MSAPYVYWREATEDEWERQRADPEALATALCSMHASDTSYDADAEKLVARMQDWGATEEQARAALAFALLALWLVPVLSTAPDADERVSYVVGMHYWTRGMRSFATGPKNER